MAPVIDERDASTMVKVTEMDRRKRLDETWVDDVGSSWVNPPFRVGL